MLYRRLIFLLAFCLGAASLHALTITHTEPRHFDKVPFTSFGELLGFHTSDPTRLVLFSDPKNHEGLYFNVTLDAKLSGVPEGTVARVEVILEDENTPREFRFSVPANKNHSHHLYLGLTSEPFTTLRMDRIPSKKKARQHLLAWRISLLDASGKILCASASPLWEH